MHLVIHLHFGWLGIYHHDAIVRCAILCGIGLLGEKAKIRSGTDRIFKFQFLCPSS